jgi:hypothetical protein
MTAPKGLARHYDVLRPAERLALLVSAQARGDDREWDRLARAAPLLRYEIPHHYPYAVSWLLTGFVHYAKVMDAAGLYAKGDAVADHPGVNEATVEAVVRTLAYLLVIELDGWDRFVAEQGLTPRVLWQGLPGAERLAETEAAARRTAYTADEMARRLRDRDPRAVLRTADSVADELRGLFDELLGRWELPPS